ncbi:glycosyl transferase group 1 [Cyanobacterium stanieri PCC 7202]|uniref:Glycosyl transferase group 1 n=1 Tax=Cyanobacterium stanieri (strain ATCC 29140 / PCC 7202) TaxID=292563 RepID=K9YHS6_CYASC|nr:glycosyl transferase group 1 [Cyanobacterium stanieri PCC 7202]
MKLLFYVPYYRPGGVERVIISLVMEFATNIEQVVLVASPSILNRLQGQIPSNCKVIYQPLTLVNYSYKNKLLGIVNKLNALAKRVKFDFLNSCKQNYYQNLVFEQIINKYNITHCLYAIANKTVPPAIKVPLFTISHDLFWHFSPLTYDQEYINKYDESLLKWLNKADGIITVSEKTKNDIVKLFPQFQEKIKIIANAGFIPSNKKSNIIINKHSDEIIFLFPSSFGIYKDHLTLVKAGVILAKEKKHNFKIVFIGKETDQILSSNINLSQQNSTKEYQNYIKELEIIYQNNKEIIDQHFLGLGYCSDEELEGWYQKSSCVIFPSRYEGFGLAISEAIVRGIPVIASDLNVFKEQVDLYQCSERVSFFGTQNAVELAQRIKNFIEKPIDILEEDKIINYQNRWNWEKVAQKYVELMDSII